LDGSRGCSYAKCDFCGLNASWCSYRRKSAKRIYELLLSILSKYGLVPIQFSDNLCDAWAGEFADLLIHHRVLMCDMTIDLRAVHNEIFYTKLSLVGFKQIQLGIEALPDPLLQKMNKGTTLIQNVQSMKYLKECGINSASNLIVNHPRSTIADVERTREILVLIPNLGKLELSDYNLAEHSAIYNSLTHAELKELAQDNVIKMPPEIFNFFTSDSQLPKHKKLSRKVRKAWSDFNEWYGAMDVKDLYLNVYRLSADTILIKDNRFGKIEEHVYSGETARVYTQCHKGQTVEQLNKETGIGASNVQKILDSFVKKRLMISSNGRYLSIALRPKEELINNYHLQRSKVMC
jgi:hypothetical protein